MYKMNSYIKIAKVNIKKIMMCRGKVKSSTVLI